MASNDDIKKKYIIAAQKETDEEGGESGGSGGSSGKIEFRSFIGTAENARDDLLSPEEIRRLLSVHKDVVHLGSVKKQKELRAYRQAVKEGKISVERYRQGLQSNGGGSKYKQNPRLNKAQFSGIDNKVNPLPNENAAETNQEKQELVYRNELKNQPVPQFNPKPQFNR